MSRNSANKERRGILGPNRFLVLLVTTRCNLSCRYCSMDAKSLGEDMELETAAKAIEVFLGGCGPSMVQFSGGEPLLTYKLVQDIVRKYRSDNLRFAVQTNGLLLDEEKLRFFAQQGVGLGVSLDGVPFVNEAQRGATRQVLEALAAADRLGIGVNLTTVLTMESVGHLPEFLMLCARFRAVRTINLDLLRQVGRAVGSSAMPSCEQMKAVVPKVSHALDYINRWRTPPLRVREFEQVQTRLSSRKLNRYCLGAKGDYGVVTPHGYVYPCASFIGQEDYCAGSIDSLNIRKLRQLTLGWSLPESCSGCPARFACRGGCPARRLVEHDDGQGPHQVDCALRKAIYQNQLSKRQLARPLEGDQ